MRKPIEQRFWRHVDIRGEDECWRWIGGRNQDGYGAFGIWVDENTSKTFRAHRIAYELTKGPIPEGLFVCHTCDNPPCCNPRHLFLGTNSDNLVDMHRKGRARHPTGEENGWAKLTWAEVDEIRTLIRNNIPKREIARRFGVSEKTIYLIAQGRRWPPELRPMGDIS
jgi:hypothetical protein